MQMLTADEMAWSLPAWEADDLPILSWTYEDLCWFVEGCFSSTFVAGRKSIL